MWYAIAGLAGLLVGGYGGYEWGRAAEAKARAMAAALKQSANNAVGNVQAAAKDLTKGL